MITLKSKTDCKWDVIGLGEVMLRFDPENDRIHTARSFRVCEGGGEYNVVRSLAKTFRLRGAMVTALADNQLGRLVEDLMKQGGVDVSQLLWRDADGISRDTRNGIYFIERGFGTRSPVGCSDRGNTAVSQLTAAEIDWNTIFASSGVRWFHTGGIFAGLSETTPEVASEAMSAARSSGTIVSYDLNYRDSLWAGRGGREAADAVNEKLLRQADVVFGVPGFDARLSAFDESIFVSAAADLLARFPNIKLAATTLRNVKSASRHDIGAAAFDGTGAVVSRFHYDLDVLDRVGSGDAFAAGLIYGLLNEIDLRRSLDLGVANAALKLAAIGDGTSATLNEVESLARGESVSVDR